MAKNIAQKNDRFDADEMSVTLTSTQSMLQSGDVNSAYMCNSFFEEIKRRKNLNAYITLTHDLATKQAEDADRRLTKGKGKPLDGIPIAIKDNFCVEGVQTTAGARILEGFKPTYDATVVKKLRNAGAVFLGKTNMDEFGMGSSTENSHFGTTLNPVGIKLGFDNLAPGGSSGGAAAAVAANLCLGAIASDTGGSIRQPASFCGVVGYKPTYGLCSRWGIAAYASSLDQAGVIAKTVEDTTHILDVIVGVDEKDSTSIDWTGGSFQQAINGKPSKMKVGFPIEFRQKKISDELENVWETAERKLREGGCEVVPVSLPSIEYALPAYYIIALSEASSNLARYDGVRYGHRSKDYSNINEMYENTRAEGFRWETKKRILMGTFALSAGYYDQYYTKALKVRRLIVNDFLKAFKSVDTLFWPTAPTSAFPFGSHEEDPVSMYLEDVFTVPVNLAGLPAISIPMALSDQGMPMGLTIAGPRLGDLNVLRLAKMIE